MFSIAPSDIQGVAAGRSVNERQRYCRSKKKARRLEQVCVLDMETDPFDAETEARIFPFCACLYSDSFEIVIWEDDEETFVDRLIAEIMSLPGSYVIYAHNGGKFDFLFLISRLRGQVMFKGRGIMSAQIGPHEIRDSFHIIPEKLASYAKDSFDYNKLKKNVRHQNKDAIIKYLISDCRNLYEIVIDFLKNYSFKISIGQAAMSELKKHYKTENIMPCMDEYLRRFFFGGRVQCLQGKGQFDASVSNPYRLYDVNSMYPYVMSEYEHPIGSQYITRRGPIGPNTVFIELECWNEGALVCRSENNETEAPHGYGTFCTTIWEYNIAIKHNLIRDIHILSVVDCEKRTNFSKFVIPLYERRQQTKSRLRTLKEGTSEYSVIKREDIFLKLIMNNAYGKFAQNPRRFKEHYITDPECRPPKSEGEWGMFPAVENKDYVIWSRPNPNIRFNNVGTAASITGAARAVLLEAMQLSTDAIYCDTDSLICRDLVGVGMDANALGAWDVEKEMVSVLIAGKKLYAYREVNGKDKIKSKGASGLKWSDMEKLLAGEIIESINAAPTFTKTGAQYYLKRRIRATAGKGSRNGIGQSTTDIVPLAKRSHHGRKSA